jgi:alpha-L-arabinofuranosidase
MRRLAFHRTASVLPAAFLPALCVSWAASSQIVRATVTIRADRPGARISPDIFGQFVEHLGSGIYGGIWVGKDSLSSNTNRYRNDGLVALNDLHVPVVR